MSCVRNGPAFPVAGGSPHWGMTLKQALIIEIAGGMGADPTWSVMTDEEWADKVIKRTDALIKRLEES